jgi:hypothetical protein
MGWTKAGTCNTGLGRGGDIERTEESKPESGDGSVLERLRTKLDNLGKKALSVTTSSFEMPKRRSFDNRINRKKASHDNLMVVC